MDKFSIFNIYKRKENDTFKCSCPSCGETCSIEDHICHSCGYNLDDYISLFYFGFEYLKNAIKLSNEKKYFEALIDTSKFLALFPYNEDANKLYIYLLIKLKKVEIYKQEIEVFESKFPRNQWLMDVIVKDFKNIKQPEIKLPEINVNNKINSLEQIRKEYVNYRIKNINDIIELTTHIYDIFFLLKFKRKEIGEKEYQSIVSFYENNYLNFLSKKEFRIENFDGKIYEELSEENKKLIDVINVVKNKSYKNGEIITIRPALYLRTKLLMKQRVYINKLK